MIREFACTRRDVIDDKLGSFSAFSLPFIHSLRRAKHFILFSFFLVLVCFVSKGVKLNFVQCIGCSLVLVYKSRTGTASLLRHRCARFPISVYDLKLAAAGQQFDLLSEMASSSHNGAIELKQEMMSDDETLELPEINHQQDDQQFTNEQTNKGLMESFSLLEKTFMTGDDDLMLTREEVELAQRNNDPDLFFER